MGAASSIHWPDLPEDLSPDDLRALIGDDIYHIYKESNPNKTISKDRLIHLIDYYHTAMRQSEAREMLHVFKQYAPMGEMNARSLTALCRDCKLLKKSVLTPVDVTLLFEKAKKQQKETSNTLDFISFTKIAIPLIAEKRGVDSCVIWSKIACLEPSHTHTLESTGDEMTQATPQQNHAAIKLQKLTRKRSAEYTVECIKAIQRSANTVDDNFFDIPEDCEDEKKMIDIFAGISDENDEVDCATLIALMKKAGVLCQRFTATDVRWAFHKTKVIAKTREKYQKGVLCDKRITYVVFREVFLPCVADRRGIAVSDLCDAIRLLESNPKPDISAEAVVVKNNFLSSLMQNVV